MDKTIIATFTPGSTFARCSLWQWDTGVQLCIQGLELTEAPLVHWGRVNECTAMVVEGTMEDGQVTCQIPDELIGEKMPGNYCVDAWIYVTDGEAGRTIRSIQITVKARKRPDSYTSTPSRAKTWDSIEADAAAAKETAADAQEAAAAAQEATETASTAAQTAQEAAQTAQKAAEGKADGLMYENPTLSLLAGEKVVSTVEIEMPEVDSELSSTSENAIQNKAVKAALDGKQAAGDYATNTALTEGLATKQAAGDYALKSEIPTVPESLKNPNSLTITTQRESTAYDGSVEKKVIADYPQVEVSGDTVSMELQPGTLYVFGTLTSLTYTLAPGQDGVIAEYHFIFTSGTTATEVTHPASVDIGTFEVEEGKTYECSILNGRLSAFDGTSQYSDLDDRVTVLEESSHAHENKSVLDGITADKVTAWDNKMDTVESLKNPNALTITVGENNYIYDGSTAINITLPDGTEVSY